MEYNYEKLIKMKKEAENELWNARMKRFSFEAASTFHAITEAREVCEGTIDKAQLILSECLEAGDEAGATVARLAIEEANKEFVDRLDQIEYEYKKYGEKLREELGIDNSGAYLWKQLYDDLYNI